MSLISASDLAKSYGPLEVFSGISLSVPRGARLAIVGPNGIGKTTLLRILLGEEGPSSGTVQRARGLSTGYLPQEASLSGSHTLWEECLRSFSGLLEQEAQLRSLEAVMSDPRRAEQALEQYGRLQPAFEARGGYTYETRVRQTLAGLGFSPQDYDRPLSLLSGGQRTRATLARLLLSDSELLVLDEPTNHLDISAVEWLEGYLANWQGTVLLVSHDRYFLDKVVNGVWELRRTRLEVYRGNYSAYLQQRQARWALRQEVFAAEKQRLEKELGYVKRNIAGQGTRQAKGRLRRLSRQVEAIESLGLEAVRGRRWLEVSGQADLSAHTMGVEEVERRIRRLSMESSRPPALRLHLRSGQRSGEIVLRTRDLVVGYPGEALFVSQEIELRRLECAAVIGPNGAGKTTFLKTILGQRRPLNGEVVLGASLKVGYFAQAHEDLVQDRTLLEEIESLAPGMLLAEVRAYLARFLFSGEDVFRKVATLSGGERGRLALAKLSLVQANLLLLDEPTNQLDIPAQEVLQEVLANYQGTILLVSHDRYLIDALATQVWEINPQSKSLRVFGGTYSEYRAQQEAERLEREAQPRLDGSPYKTRRPARPSPDEHRRQTRLQEVEARVAQLEEQLGAIALQLENPPSDPLVVQTLGEDYVQLQDEINALLSEWEQLHVSS
jgi:ATP-binding cassette subfamily F protein 3